MTVPSEPLNVRVAKLPLFLEMSNVAIMLGLSYSGTRRLVEVGGLTPAARTCRGCLLFDLQHVKRVQRKRWAAKTAAAAKFGGPDAAR